MYIVSPSRRANIGIPKIWCRVEKTSNTSSTMTARLPTMEARISTMRPVMTLPPYPKEYEDRNSTTNDFTLHIPATLQRPTTHYNIYLQNVQQWIDKVSIANQGLPKHSWEPERLLSGTNKSTFGSPFSHSFLDASTVPVQMNLQRVRLEIAIFNRGQPFPGSSVLVQPTRAWSVGWLWMKFRTDGPGRCHSPSTVGHQPPVRRCFNTSWLASWKAMSRLGARWFEKMEQYLNIALKHSNTSVATPTRGPKRRISDFKWVRRWSLILDTIFEGSTVAKRSRTFATATSMSD